MSPRAQNVRFGLRQPGARVHHCINTRRHDVLARISTHPRKSLRWSWLTYGIYGPAREIEIRTAVLDVIRKQPRNRGNVRVPGPTRFVGVAVVARASKQRIDATGNSDELVHFSVTGQLALRALGTNKLDADRDNDKQSRGTSGPPFPYCAAGCQHHGRRRCAALYPGTPKPS